MNGIRKICNCKEKCIDLFKRDYSKSWGDLLSKIINKTVAFLR